MLDINGELRSQGRGIINAFLPRIYKAFSIKDFLENIDVIEVTKTILPIGVFAYGQALVFVDNVHYRVDGNTRQTSISDSTGFIDVYCDDPPVECSIRPYTAQEIDEQKARIMGILKEFHASDSSLIERLEKEVDVVVDTIYSRQTIDVTLAPKYDVRSIHVQSGMLLYSKKDVPEFCHFKHQYKGGQRRSSLLKVAKLVAAES